LRPPRGQSSRNFGARVATAAWASSDEILEHEYKHGDIFLGTIETASEEAKPVLAELDQFITMLFEDQAIDDGWKAGQIELAERHIALLNRTSTRMIGIGDDRHMLTGAGSRSGKGTSAIITNLCLYPGSVLCIDPKGENARLTATRRGKGSAYCEGMGQKTIILDPYNVSRTAKDQRGSWNPLDLLRDDDPEMVDKAASIAEALIVRAKSEDAHFDDTARAFIKGLILFVAITHAGKLTRNLLTVHQLLMRGATDDLDPDRDAPEGSDAITMLLCQMATRDDLDGAIAGAGHALLDMGDRERGSVLSTARRNLEFIERPAMRDALRSSSFDLNEVKTAKDGMTIYLCLPQQRMADCGRWLRLMINTALERIYEIDEEPATGHPILFLLEEFAGLGHMATIENAAGYAAGFGVKLWVIIQDLSQLKRWYKDGWETFLGNAGVIQAFANSDTTTLDYLSKKLGEVEVTQSIKNTTTSLTASTNDPGESQRVQSLIQNRGAMSLFANPLTMVFDQGSTGQSATSTSSYNEQVQRTPLMLPDEIERYFRRESQAQLVAVKGLAPFILDRSNYYDSVQFSGLYEPLKGPKLTIAEAAARRNAAIVTRRAKAKQAIEAALTFVSTTRKAVEDAKSGRR
jgi:type IV secretion system protein VirD4